MIQKRHYNGIFSFNFHTPAVWQVFRNWKVYRQETLWNYENMKEIQVWLHFGFERIVPVILARILPPDVALLPKDKWISSLAGTFSHLKEKE